MTKESKDFMRVHSTKPAIRSAMDQVAGGGALPLTFLIEEQRLLFQVERNSLRFDGKQPNFGRVCYHIKSWLFDIAKISGGHMNNSVADLSILHSLDVVGVLRKAPLITSVCWYPPLPSWLKLNTDGLAKVIQGLLQRVVFSEIAEVL